MKYKSLNILILSLLLLSPSVLASEQKDLSVENVEINYNKEVKNQEEYTKKDADFFVTAVKNDVSLYKENDTKLLPNMRTYHVKYIYELVSGEQYYSLYDRNNQWQGCVKASDVVKASSLWGIHQTVDQYVQIKNKNYKIYSNKEWKSTYTAEKFYPQTLKVKSIYYHFNGSTYYSIYDNKDNWIGYINQEGLSKVSSPWGNAITDDSYISVVNQNYSIYNNKDWNEIAKSSKYAKQTLRVKNIYHHYNGNIYDSLYTQDNKWIGYINHDAVKTAKTNWGIKWNKSCYATVVNSNYSIYRSQDFNNKASFKDYNQKTIRVTGYYRHINGETYYSIENKDGKWIGYVNGHALKLSNDSWGSKIEKSSYVLITSNNYKIYSNKDWTSNKTTKNYYKQTLKATGYYRHFNGETYYSLENNKRDWIGYVNAKSTSKTTPQGEGYSFGNKTMEFCKKGYAIYSNLEDFNSKKGLSDSYMNQGINVKWAYKHFNGETYYSLYNKDNKWLGYVNSDSMKNAHHSRYYFSQKSDQWNEYYIRNTHSTMYEIGCAPTSIAMGLNILHQNQNYTNPWKVADSMARSGVLTDDGTTADWNLLPRALGNVGLNARPLYNSSNSEITTALRNGHIVLLDGKGNNPFTFGGHYIIATAISSKGSIYILDPWNSNNNKWWSINEVQHSGLWRSFELWKK